MVAWPENSAPSLTTRTLDRIVPSTRPPWPSSVLVRAVILPLSVPPRHHVLGVDVGLNVAVGREDHVASCGDLPLGLAVDTDRFGRYQRPLQLGPTTHDGHLRAEALVDRRFTGLDRTSAALAFSSPQHRVSSRSACLWAATRPRPLTVGDRTGSIVLGSLTSPRLSPHRSPTGGIVNPARVLEREVRREAHDVCGGRPTGTTV